MAPLAPGSLAPPVTGVDLTGGPTILLFYKVTCPVCQMAAPKVQTFEDAYPGRIAGVGQDPVDRLEAFEREFGVTFPSVTDEPPYPASEAYGIRIVPTAFLVADGVVVTTVEAWDRQGLNGMSRRMSELTGAPFTTISEPADGLPPFRPG